MKTTGFAKTGLATLVILAATQAQAQQTPYAYAIDGDTSTDAPFYRIDLNTYAITQIGTVTGDTFESLSFGPGANTLYAYTDSGNDLYTIDINNGTQTLVGATGVNTSDAGLAYCPDNSTMYLAGESNELFTVNLNTGAATLVGATGTSVTGLECVNGILYGADDSSDSLYSLDRGTGASTLIGALTLNGNPVDISDGGLGLAPNGDLLLVEDSVPSNLYRIDTATGAMTILAELDPGDLSLESLASEFGAAPEEFSARPVPALPLGGLLGLATGLLLLARRQLGRR